MRGDLSTEEYPNDVDKIVLVLLKGEDSNCYIGGIMTYQQLFKRFIKKEKFLFFSLVLSVAIIIAQKSLENVPEKVPFGEELGKILFPLGIGYILTYFFYFMVTFVKQERDREKMADTLLYYSWTVWKEGKSLFSALKASSKKNMGVPPEEQEVEEVLKAIDLDKGPIQGMDGSRKGWHEFLEIKNSNSQTNIKKLLELSEKMDTEHLKVLWHIRESKLFSQIAPVQAYKYAKETPQLVRGSGKMDNQKGYREELKNGLKEYSVLIYHLGDIITKKFNHLHLYQELQEREQNQQL